MREQICDEVLDEAFELFKLHLAKKLEKHGRGEFVGLHETLGILTEEYYEVIEAAKSNSREDFISELADVAVVAIFGIASLINYDPKA